MLNAVRVLRSINVSAGAGSRIIFFISYITTFCSAINGTDDVAVVIGNDESLLTGKNVVLV
jgi:hypothetical protein